MKRLFLIGLFFFGLASAPALASETESEPGMSSVPEQVDVQQKPDDPKKPVKEVPKSRRQPKPETVKPKPTPKPPVKLPKPGSVIKKPVRGITGL